MRYMIQAACGCNRGKIRINNEDNFYFDGQCLEAVNNGLDTPMYMGRTLKGRLCLAVFDGMGGENFGEYASFTAAKELQRVEGSKKIYFVSPAKYLKKLAIKLNDAVVSAAEKKLTEHMGTTMAALYFISNSVYVCNLGDSRAYCLRGRAFMQLSKDDLESYPRKEGKKTALTQHLGIAPEDMRIEPHISKWNLNAGDQYLLCSDGLTDMLSNIEISDIMMKGYDAKECVSALIEASLAHGGRDNITVIMCRIGSSDSKDVKN